ncbi:hypothetical protein GW17_00059154 [Ensete ventricosum]|nr:hypothetical protein GW17_00059154 [Ensete ventricosum]
MTSRSLSDLASTGESIPGDVDLEILILRLFDLIPSDPTEEMDLTLDEPEEDIRPDRSTDENEGGRKNQENRDWESKHARMQGPSLPRGKIIRPQGGDPHRRSAMSALKHHHIRKSCTHDTHAVVWLGTRIGHMQGDHSVQGMRKPCPRAYGN